MVKALKNNLLLVVFMLVSAVYSLYPFFPSSLPDHILKIPYIILVVLGIIFFIGILRKKYALKGLTRLMFFLVFALGVVYAGVTVLRFLNGGVASARPSLYLAMSILFSTAIYFSYYFSILPNRHFKRDILLMLSMTNFFQLIIGLFIYGGLRASFLLENIMVYIFLVAVTLPLLFIFLNRSQNKLAKFAIYSNIIVGVTFVSLSGSRAGVLLIWGILFSCFIMNLIVYKREMLKKFAVILLGTVCLAGVLYATNAMNARESVNRASFSYNIGEEQLDAVEQNPESSQSKDIIEEIRQSDFLRSALWEKSVAEIIKSPVVGTGVVYFECTYGPIVLQQGSHNIVMEVWLTFGLIGLVVYGLLYLSVVIYLIRKMVKGKNKAIPAMYLLSMCGAFALALLQPLMVMLLPNMFLWLVLSNGVKENDSVLRKGQSHEMAES